MDPFALQSTRFLSAHSHLFDFNMTQVADHTGHPFFTDTELQTHFTSEADRLTALGETHTTHRVKQIVMDRPVRKWKGKKQAEVEHFFQFLEEVLLSGGDVVDVGAGRGYLTSRLASEYNVYAVEKNPHYSKCYPESVTVVNEEITQHEQLQIGSNPALVGLHSCGTLTPTCLRNFVSGTATQLALISCCYHKMGDNTAMSNAFKQFKMSRYFLRMACQRRGATANIENEVNHLHKKTGVAEHLLKVVVEAQSSLQRLAELVVQLDRVSYLRENGFRAELVELMRLPPLLRSELKNLLLSMPKDLPKLQAIRKTKTMSGQKYPAGIVNLQVLGDKSVYLFTDQTRYLFNCGEGTQRLAHEHKMKLAKLEHVFVTGNRWGCVGGLPGVALTVQDIGVDRLFVHGPPGVNRLFEATRRFIILKDLKITTVNTLTTPHYSDHVLHIDYINLDDGAGQKLDPTCVQSDDIDYYSYARKAVVDVEKDDEVLSRGVAVCYVCKLKKKEGTLLIDKCIEMGVPPGPMLGRLKAGEDVVLGDGRVVRAGDVRSPDCPGPTFIILDVPTLSHLDSLLKQDFSFLQTPTAFVHVIVHFTPKPILQSPLYQKWMQSFNISTKHLIVNDCCPEGSEAVHRMQTKLNLVDGEVFPLLKVKKVDPLDLPVPTIYGETLMRVCLRPRVDVDSSLIPTITPTAYEHEVLSNPETAEKLALYKSTPKPNYTPTKSTLLFLGTGSSIPNKTRNVSSFILQVDEHTSIMFDCGEGSFSQLERIPDYNMDTLKCIYISHLHADHHLGLVSFLKLKKVTLIAPVKIQSWLEMYKRDFEQIDYDLVSCESLLKSDYTNYGVTMRTCYVKHCPNAFGVSVVTEEKKIVYSGDTMPCEGLVELGRGADLLIHEGTMEDDLAKEATLKQHSTISQAISMGQEMDAKFTLLTHFSQRYSKIPLIKTDLENVGVAFDNMRVNVGGVGVLGGMMGVLEGVFSEDVEEMDLRMLKRRRRREMELSQVV